VDVPGFDDDEFTEIYDAQFPRVDLVGKAANGMRFLIAKEAAATGGLLDPAYVRDLIAKGEDGDVSATASRQEMPNGITLSGDPAAIAAFIHKAALRDRARGPGDPATDGSLTEEVSKDMGPELDGDPGEVTAMDVTVPLAEPVQMAPGDPTVPGSPAWESIDAASAQKWLSLAARLKNALSVLAEREMLEAASADPDDIENAWNLEDATCAVDYAIGQLAVFAAGEQATAELGAEVDAIGKALAGFDPAPLDVIEGLTAIRKAGRVLSSANEAAIRGAVEQLQKVLASLPEAPVITKSKEGAMPGTQTAGAAPATAVAKEGTPATPEEQARNAGPVSTGGTTGLGQPRQTGPAAALPDDGPQKALPGDTGRTVIKGTLKVALRDMARRMVHVRADRIQDPAEYFAQLAKADGEGDGKVTMQAVFDEEGNLVGIVDPADITPVSGAGGKPEAEPAGDAGDMTPQPQADAGTPSEDVTPDGQVAKSGDENTTTGIPLDMLKSAIREAVAEQAGALRPAQDVAKSADVAELNAQVGVLKAQVAELAKQPAMPKVFTAGAVPPRGDGPVPPAEQLRGQDKDNGAPLVDFSKAAELKKTLYTGSGPQQAQAFHQLEAMSQIKFAEIRARAAQSPAVPG
jgi:hypothetical protein